MSGCDQLDDAICAKAAHAMRRWSAALDRAGLAPDQMLSAEDLAAALKFSALFPEPATQEDGHDGF